MDTENLNNSTILIFTTRQLCYSSAVFFAARLGEAIEQLGFSVEMCELDSLTNTCRGDESFLSEESELKLEQYVGRSFDAVIDFNSRLPRMIMEDGSYYLDHINAPFYDYILDHPLYHYNSLSCRLHNFHVIMVDQNHCDYVRKYYPHIRNVTCQTLGASEAVNAHTFEEKKVEILFPGTYRDPQEYMDQIKNSGLKKLLLDLTNRMMEDGSLTIEAALQSALSDQGMEFGMELGQETDLKLGPEAENRRFAALLNQVYLVEMYIRNYHRKTMIDALVGAHLPVAIAGEWWEQYGYANRPNRLQNSLRITGKVVFEHPVTFAQSFERIARSAVLVDSSPFFQMGLHDRIFAGMANHTAVLTDWNPCKQKLFEIKGKIGLHGPNTTKIMKPHSILSGVTYRLKDPIDLVYKAEELLVNRELRRDITDNAYDIFHQDHEWIKVASRILEAH